MKVRTIGYVLLTCVLTAGLAFLLRATIGFGYFLLALPATLLALRVARPEALKALDGVFELIPKQRWLLSIVAAGTYLLIAPLAMFVRLITGFGTQSRTVSSVRPEVVPED